MNAITDKIAALLKRNTENGASEAEAMSAMKHAQKLMKQHGITLADIRDNNDAANDFVKKHVNPNEQTLSSFDNLLATSIANYTDTKVWVDKKELRTSKLMFFGYRVDVELAEYIREVCKRAGDTEWKKYSKELPKGGRARARKSFLVGMALRLRERLTELKNENINESSTGQELVVVKSQVVNHAYANLGMKLRSSGRVNYNANNAFTAGKSAANNVRFNRAVHGGPTGGTRMIASK